MFIYSCIDCKYVDIMEINGEKKCPRCGGLFISLGISTSEWNKLDIEQSRKLIDEKISKYNQVKNTSSTISANDNIDEKNYDDLSDTSLFNVCELLEGTVDLKGESLKDIVYMDLLRFIMYLSYADGSIATEEVDYINNFFDTDFTIEQISEMIINQNIYSEEYENNIPRSFKIFVSIDSNNAKKNNLDLHVANIYISCLRNIGLALIKADGKFDK